jgi:hypothetical protein
MTLHFLHLPVTSLPTPPAGPSHRLHPSPVLTSSWLECHALTGGCRRSPAPQPAGRLPHWCHHPGWSSSRAPQSPHVSCPGPHWSTAIPIGLDFELPAPHRMPSPTGATTATGQAKARDAVPPTGHHLHAARCRAISHPQSRHVRISPKRQPISCR